MYISFVKARAHEKQVVSVLSIRKTDIVVRYVIWKVIYLLDNDNNL